MVDLKLKIFLAIRFQILRHFHIFESEEASDAMSARREAHAKQGIDERPYTTP